MSVPLPTRAPRSLPAPASVPSALPTGDPSPVAAALSKAAAVAPIRLHLGCGSRKLAGWINVDARAEVGPDLVSRVDRLPSVADASVDVIEANHLFEHLTLADARRALREWRRVLMPGGELFLELPDLAACIRLLGQHFDEQGYDLAMVGIYGWPPDVESGGVPQMHKWGWTRSTLAAELSAAGFSPVEFVAPTQTHRIATRLGRDLRVRAVR